MGYSMQNKQGFSLIELMIVVALIGIISGIAYMGVNVIQRERVKSATRQILGDIQGTRMSALTTMPTGTTSLGYGIRFVLPNSYVLFAFNDVNTDFVYSGTSEEYQPATQVVSSPLQLSLSGLNTGFTVLIYNRFGMPTWYKSDGSDSVQQDATIVIQDPSVSQIKCIVVSMNSIREGVWSGTTCVQQ